jgi:hypothetical protein
MCVCNNAQPPQERLSIRETINFRIDIGRYNKYHIDIQMHMYLHFLEI